MITACSLLIVATLKALANSCSFCLDAKRNKKIKADEKFGQMLRLAARRKITRRFAPRTDFSLIASLALICYQIFHRPFSSQLTAHSLQLTAHSSQLIAQVII